MIPGVNPDLLQLKLNVLDFVYEKHEEGTSSEVLFNLARELVEWLCEPVTTSPAWVEEMKDDITGRVIDALAKQEPATPAAAYKVVLGEDVQTLTEEASDKALDQFIAETAGPEPTESCGSLSDQAGEDQGKHDETLVLEPVGSTPNGAGRIDNPAMGTALRSSEVSNDLPLAGSLSSNQDAASPCLDAGANPGPQDSQPVAAEPQMPMTDRLVDALFKIGREGVTTTGLAHAVGAKDRDAISPHISTLYAERRLVKHYPQGMLQPRLYHPHFKPNPCIETPPPTQPEMILDYLKTDAGEKGATFVMVADALKLKETSCQSALSAMYGRNVIEADQGIGKHRRFWAPGMRPAASRAESNRFYREADPVPPPAPPVNLNQVVECPGCKRQYRAEFANQTRCTPCSQKYKSASEPVA